ncbi:MAG: HAMP domain-containing sensor histidine kinase [Anaerolineales bacterium]
MGRRLRWAALLAVVIGIQAALLARLILPEGGSLYWTFASDPASLLLVVALGLALILAALSVAFQWHEGQMQDLQSSMSDKQEVERRRFIQRLDHELKNPLTAIQIQLDNLQDSSNEQASLDDVRAQANRLVDLTRGLRRLSDLETRPLEIETIDIGELLREVIELLQSQSRTQIEVQKLPWPLPPLDADRELLLLAVRNVVANALTYSRDEVQIRGRQSAGNLVIEVLDTGRGIPDDDLEHVTEELYRGGNVHDMPGSGLGLSIVQRIIERHHGRLELMSRPDQGTIVSLIIPYHDE